MALGSPTIVTLPPPTVMTAKPLLAILATGSSVGCDCFREPFSCLSPSLLIVLDSAFYSFPQVFLVTTLIMRQIRAQPFLPNEPNCPFFLYLSFFFFHDPSLPPVLSNLKNGGFNSGSARLLRVQNYPVWKVHSPNWLQKLGAILPVTALRWF